jgi:hypothetical protein
LGRRKTTNLRRRGGAVRRQSPSKYTRNVTTITSLPCLVVSLRSRHPHAEAGGGGTTDVPRCDSAAVATGDSP